MNLARALAETATALQAAGFEEPRRRARRVVAAALDLPPAVTIGHPERALSPAEAGRVRAVLDRVVAREPLSRILGRREFWGLDLALDGDTLDPRPETETLVAAVLRRLPDRGLPLAFLDLGTGSGAILLALLSECAAASGLGGDLALGAARAARPTSPAANWCDCRPRSAAGTRRAPSTAALTGSPPTGRWRRRSPAGSGRRAFSPARSAMGRRQRRRRSFRKTAWQS
jgi:methylase of polypeptide subunit release factors